MTEPGELREPDLPRTAKVRPTGPAHRVDHRRVRLGGGQGRGRRPGDRPRKTASRSFCRRAAGSVPCQSCRLLPGAARPGGASGGERAEAVVVKDAGDDPDVTHGAHLTARSAGGRNRASTLDGGEGVGVVTKPGLGMEVGSPAINPAPRQMITQAVGEVTDLAERGARVPSRCPAGERWPARRPTPGSASSAGSRSWARRGSSGRSRPRPGGQASSRPWRWLAAQGERRVVLCTGGRTERAAMALLPGLPEVSFVEVGDFTGAALRRVMEHGVPRVIFVGMAGKLAKLAAGVLMTHYTRSRVSTGPPRPRSPGRRAVVMRWRRRSRRPTRPARGRAVGGSRAARGGRDRAVPPGRGSAGPVLRRDRRGRQG